MSTDTSLKLDGVPADVLGLVADLRAALDSGDVSAEHREAVARHITPMLKRISIAKSSSSKRRGAGPPPDPTASRDDALAHVERLRKHADRVGTADAERRVRVGVAKGVAAGTLDREDVYEVMQSVAKSTAGDRAWAADEVGEFAAWLDSPEGAGWWVLYSEADAPSPSADLAKREEEADPIAKRAVQRFPDLDEPDAVAAYLDTAEGAKHYAAEHG